MGEGVIRQAGRSAEDHGVRVLDHPGSLTTRQRRRRPLLLVHTGDGKGKTTAAMGLALRGWAQGWSIAVVQFVKSGRWPTGEKAALLALGRLHDETGEGGPVTWYQAGLGWTWARPSTSDGGRSAAQTARDGWACAAGLLAQGVHDLLVLDELTYPLNEGWVATDDVVAAVRTRPGHQHVVVTGRRCPQALLDAADLVTDMSKVRHPFDAGIRGQRGIEW